MTPMQALVVVAALLVCACICGAAWGIAHDGTTPAQPAPTTTRR
jgi:hypothetical protein